MRSFISRTITAIAIAAALTPPLVAIGQSQGEATRAQSVVERVLEPRLFDLSFPGGDLEEYVAALRKAHGEANIAIVGAPEEVSVAKMELRNVTLDGAIKIIERNSLNKGRQEFVQVRSIAMQGKSEHAYRIEAVVQDRADLTDLTSSVWSIAENIAAGFNPHDLLGAVQVALATFPTEATLRFHEPTSLLIVRGTKAQLALAGETLAQLRSDAHRQFDEIESTRGRIAMLEPRREKAAIEAQVAAKEHEIAVKRLELEKEQLELDGIKEELDKHLVIAPLELAVVKAEARLRIARSEVAIYDAQLQDLRAKLKSPSSVDD